MIDRYVGSSPVKALAKIIRCSLFATVLLHFVLSLPGYAAQAHITPWSGWWWPSMHGGLATGADYRGRPAPLEKYLMLTEGISSGPLITWYLQRYYNPNALRWHGLCPYFARAAILDAYEILPSSEDNLVVRVGDKKGLLTLCHDFVIAEVTASGSDPANLHSWLEEYIGSQGKSFMADLGSGGEVWYFPVYAYDIQVVRTGPNTRSVTAYIYYADDNVHPDYMGTKQKSSVYTYDLIVDAAGKVIDGYYTGFSIGNYPIMLSLPITTAPQCPYLDCTEVRRMAKAADDFLETPADSIVSILPGTYNLVLLNQDKYRIDGLPGDEALVVVKKEDGSKQNMTVKIADNTDNEITSHELSSESSMIYRISMQSPPYIISLTQADYSDPNIYSLTLDLRGAWRQPAPHIPKGGQWSGFALTNAGLEAAEDVMLVTGKSDGRPLHTVFGPVDLAPGEKQKFFFDELPLRRHEIGTTTSIMLVSRHPVEMLNLFAFDEQAMAGFGGSPPKGDRLIIPNIYYDAMSGERFMRGMIKNESFFIANLRLRLYSAAGQMRNEITEQLSGGAALPVLPGTSPFSQAPDNGWMEIVSTNGRSLSGYQYVEYRSGTRGTIDTLFALPATSGRKIVPHVPPALGRWETWLTVINPNNRKNRVTVHPALAGTDTQWDHEIELAPYEKRKIDVSGFGKTEGDPLYRSILLVTSEHPMAGHYMYSPPGGGDEAMYPLLDDAAFKNELVLAHHADEGGRWWTGVGLLNPNTYPVEISLNPHDGTGSMAEYAAQTLTLNPGAYEVFTVRNRFGEAAADIAFMTFTAKEPLGAPIGGFYLYGNTGNRTVGNMKSLAGANM
ncbi:MAG: hypothetical protein C4548_16965 [Desulfobacteraceae bacterium]|jgi:hypothetical protein|nr:MAG: hypothetical protein C4548_16965 [Desulfobacteraceae bacterium]